MNQPLRKHRLYLTGYRGTGKSTVGRLLATQLGCDCVDLDDQIEAAAGKSIRDIFAEGGEPTFRDWETRCLRQVAGEDASADQTGSQPECSGVIALGGGAILRDENRSVIAESGHCVWLVASPQTIAQRLSADASTAQRRPALTELSPTEEVAQVLRAREPLYRDAADFSVDTEGKSPQDIAEEVLGWWNQAAKHRC